MDKKLKIGLLIDSINVPYWAYLMIEKINQSNYAKINLVIINGSKPTKNNIITKIKNNRDYFMYKEYTRFENRIYKQTPNAFEIYDLTKIMTNTKQLTVIPKQAKYSDWIEP